MWYNNQAVKLRPVGQAVKTLASHAGNMGSIPVRVTKKKSTAIAVLFLFVAPFRIRSRKAKLSMPI